MNTRRDIQGFVDQRTLAIVGMSRAPKSFSVYAARLLRAKGYRVFPVNPNAAEVEGERCYPSLGALPEKVGGALLLTPPAATGKAVREAIDAGVQHVWIQQGAESPEALACCKERNVSAVWGQCILMFAEPVGSFHRVHRWLRRVAGGLPGP